MTSGDCLIVIPARYGSTRLPGKPLLHLAGKPLIAWVVEAALQAQKACGVVVATDHPEIAEAAQAAGAQVALTSSALRNGTERLLAITADFPASYYLNLQGDEPLVNPAYLDRLIGALQSNAADVLSLCHSITAAQAQEPSRVKVARGQNGRALYFSRSPIPYGSSCFEQHVGVYGFSAQALATIRQLRPTALEEQESLEQLRWLEAGLSIQLLSTQTPSLGVDCPEDVAPVEQILRLRQIRALLCDVDGVLTDGRLWYGPDGEELKAFHSRDGFAIKQLIQRGIQVALVSGRDSLALRRRMAELGIQHAVLGQPDKASACRQIAAELGVDLEACAYVGDDSLDLPGMECCGWSFAVADAPEVVQSAARSVLNTCGGEGAIREVAQMLLEAMP
ncbi:3-deoxy-manno-octulosonate cytidylyltransferase [Synechococcus sp. A10-1-5-1]|uniref:3-deoxy-manno-octulosonate cytidylyltransferase n=1 Tax=Synechococcus sp. A10-1-5-1 TaxID=2936507 RepID=UPI0020011E97|nr:3-deoxy-manno-octulosonate cytidylyltransferase [Synechococcus sp. A10-1-5-1]UPM49187.1 3-deoxy-manno-octulosonate cytidylyltransferase [Synechococcus sp. A10-1-5-1]